VLDERRDADDRLRDPDDERERVEEPRRERPDDFLSAM